VGIAYALTWICLGLYTVRLFTRRRKLERLWQEKN
jgi:CcmD family protein